MLMDEGEIRRQYKYAKDRKKCITILAELNCCSREKIKQILGLEERGSGGRTEPGGDRADALYAKLNELDSVIRPLEEEYRHTVAELMKTEKRK